MGMACQNLRYVLKAAGTGIGANTAIFTLKPCSGVPFRRRQRVVSGPGVIGHRRLRGLCRHQVRDNELAAAKLLPRCHRAAVLCQECLGVSELRKA